MPPVDVTGTDNVPVAPPAKLSSVESPVVQKESPEDVPEARPVNVPGVPVAVPMVIVVAPTKLESSDVKTPTSAPAVAVTPPPAAVKGAG